MASTNSPGINAYLEGFKKLPRARQVGVIAAVLGVVALTVLVLMWAQRPTYKALYNNLEMQDAGEVVQAIEQMKIPYRLDEKSGAILVPASKVHEVRLQLAAQGLPRGGSVSGFELLDKQQGFGISRFMESRRYQQALEGELARSIATLRNVKSARVHLAMPKQSVFIREREKPSASVVVNLYPGQVPTERQVQAIVHLVASAIPGLAADRVTVVDQTGQLLTNREKDSELDMTHQQFAYTRRVEQSYVSRIEAILAPIIGNKGVKAQVSAELDFTRSEQTQERYDPERTAVRSEQRLEEQVYERGESGIPGALSNEPPGAALAPEVVDPAQREAGRGVPLRNKRNATINYEVDKTISHVRNPVGVIRRLSVAVVVDDVLSTNEAGELVRTPRTPEDMARITALVKEAVGFDAERGDSVNVVNASFVADTEPAEAEPWWQQAWVLDAGRQLLGWLLALVLIFAVLRPLLRSLTQLPEVKEPETQEEAVDEVTLQQQAMQAEMQREMQAATHEDNLKNAKEIARQDPKRVVQVVRTWLEEEQPNG